MSNGRQQNAVEAGKVTDLSLLRREAPRLRRVSAALRPCSSRDHGDRRQQTPAILEYLPHSRAGIIARV